MRLPPKRKKERTKDVFKREYPRHRRFVRSHSCSVAGCPDGPIECAHVRRGLGGIARKDHDAPCGRGGTSLKPHDAFSISLCRGHHAEQHTVGERVFARKYGLDLVDIALAFAKASPVGEVRDFVKGMDVYRYARWRGE